ncbi:MAG: trypsin-like peptidase domain-containing protein [Cyanobacteria bacterium P01_C01_bin.121]
MTFEDSKRAIAKIHLQNNPASIVGTGFLIADRYLLTCAHVVREALFGAAEAVGDTLQVTFYGASEPQSAEVVFFDLDASYGCDAAVLYLMTESPANAIAPRFPLRQIHEAPLQVFGYPGDTAGRNLTAVTRGEIDGGWVQVEDTKETGLAIEPGFSGSPVWQQSNPAGIIGMVVARHQSQNREKVGFILPMQKLQGAIKAIERHALLMLLRPHQDALAEPIATAYKVCRPETWPEPFQSQLESRLVDLSLMSEVKLLEFAACLCGLPDVAFFQTELLAWLEQFKSDDMELSTLLSRMRYEQENVPTSSSRQPMQPCLLICIQAAKNTQKDPYQVNAWLLPDSRKYNPKTGQGYNFETGEGAEELSSEGWQKYAEDPNAVDMSQGIRYEHLPLLLATYIDQVTGRGISFSDLTVEFFLPMALMNQPIEQCTIPDEFGVIPLSLGINQDCAHVVIRSQERLDYARGKGLWKRKWNQLQAELNSVTGETFVDGDTLSLRDLQTALKSALGLRLAQKKPKAAKQGEIGVLLATGTPAAVWLRCQSCDLAERLQENILSACLEQLPTTVGTLRRGTPALEDAQPEDSTELGHHVSFLWEDFYRVPPTITYSDRKL